MYIKRVAAVILFGGQLLPSVERGRAVFFRFPLARFVSGPLQWWTRELSGSDRLKHTTDGGRPLERTLCEVLALSLCDLAARLSSRTHWMPRCGIQGFLGVYASIYTHARCSPVFFDVSLENIRHMRRVRYMYRDLVFVYASWHTKRSEVRRVACPLICKVIELVVSCSFQSCLLSDISFYFHIFFLVMWWQKSFTGRWYRCLDNVAVGEHRSAAFVL